MTTPARGYVRYAWGVLAFNLFVILWGAYVRASGSGAGCGSHWPLCNGEVLPRSPAAATLIEFGHRLTSGVALLLVVGLVIGARRVFPPRHGARRAAYASGILILTEALIGAGLVLLEYVADDASIARGFWVSGHLANTFLLVAALTLTPLWAAGLPGPRLRGHVALASVFAIALAGVLVLGTSGAVTALGDTLFPVTSWAEGKAQTFSETAHLFVRLRIWHPTLAVAVGGAVVVAALVALRSDVRQARLARGVVSLYLLELAIGLLNVWTLAPMEIQLVHLLLADLIWITLVALTASALAERPEPRTARSVGADGRDHGWASVARPGDPR
jgi:heme A synthase